MPLARRRLAHEHNRNSSSSSKARDEEMDPLMQAVVDYLSKMALQRGSSDNITVVVVDLLAKRNAMIHHWMVKNMGEMSPPSEKQEDLKVGLDDPAREARRRRMEIKRL
eukprot:Gb_15299 [translate_table: standard]